MSNTPAMPQPDKDLGKMELKDLQKEVATLRLFIASLQETLADYVDRERLSEALNHRIAEIETEIGLTRSLVDNTSTRLHHLTSQQTNSEDMQRTLRTLSSRLDALERKANKNVS